MKKSVALFGGSFDPPHKGHLQIMKEALKKLPIEKLIVVPAFINPFKKGHAAPPELRLKWLKKLASFDPRIEVSDYEIKKEGPSYTINTVRHYAKSYNPIYLIIGADNLEGLRKWHDYEALAKMVRWVVATREGYGIPDGFLKLTLDQPISSTQLREHLDPRWIPEEIREEVLHYYLSHK